MSSPDQRRRVVEELHAQTQIGQELEGVRAALGKIRDKGSVIRIASRVLGGGPQHIDGGVRIGNFEFGFDADGNLTSLSNWTGGIVIQTAMTDGR